MRRRSKTARLSGGAVGVEGPIGCGADAGSAGWQVWLLWMTRVCGRTAGTCLRHTHNPPLHGQSFPATQ